MKHPISIEFLAEFWDLERNSHFTVLPWQSLSPTHPMRGTSQNVHRMHLLQNVRKELLKCHGLGLTAPRKQLKATMRQWFDGTLDIVILQARVPDVQWLKVISCARRKCPQLEVLGQVYITLLHWMMLSWCVQCWRHTALPHIFSDHFLLTLFW